MISLLKGFEYHVQRGILSLHHRFYFEKDIKYEGNDLSKLDLFRGDHLCVHSNNIDTGPNVG